MPIDKIKPYFVLSPPQMTVLSDAAIQEIADEKFELISKLGPVYDIIRHPQTKTPMAIAIYGDWGTGKTSAMRWLQEILDQWNQHGKDSEKEKLFIRTVWFDPWKYSKREEVWRGLIAEVIINSIDIKNLDTHNAVTRLTSAAKQFGGFLGRGFLQALASLNIKTGIPGAAPEPLEVNFSALRDIYDEYLKVSHPEKAYLNEFETALKDWLERTLGKDKKERMVIFIDDLDRCLPEVALEVLEALKLYLNLEKLIFIVGVDRSVVDKLVKKHYEGLEVPAFKAEKYLDKMFQVEVNITPSEDQVNKFFDYQIMQLDDLAGGYWKNTLGEKERGILDPILRRLSTHNPREVKRLLNCALIQGAAAATHRKEDEKKRFAQGVQVFLIMKVLDFFHPTIRGEWITTNDGQKFFENWSGIVRKNTNIKPPPITGGQQIPWADNLDEESGVEEKRVESEKDIGILYSRKRRIWNPLGKEELSEVPSPYKEFYEEWIGLLRREQLADLISDPDLFELMKIEFSSEVASRTAGITTPEPFSKMSAMPIEIAQAVARQLRKNVESLTAEDYSNIKELDISSTKIIDLFSLQIFTKLQALDLSYTAVQDLTPLQNLTALQRISLIGTRVRDLSALQGLINLQELILKGTMVLDLSPLQSLIDINWLDLSNTPIQDLSPLQRLNKLETLIISDTRIDEEQIQALSEALPELKILKGWRKKRYKDK